MQGVDERGDVWMAINDRKASPALPDSDDVGPVPVTIGSVGDSNVQWRAVSVRGPDGELITVAVDLSDLQSTVDSLVLLQAAIGGGVLLVLGVVGYWVVHRSLQPWSKSRRRPPRSPGQLDSRVPQGDPRTEVGQLALALNGMLARIPGRWRHRRPRRRVPGSPSSACADSSPTPVTSCARR